MEGEGEEWIEQQEARILPSSYWVPNPRYRLYEPTTSHSRLSQQFLVNRPFQRQFLQLLEMRMGKWLCIEVLLGQLEVEVACCWRLEEVEVEEQSGQCCWTWGGC